VSAPKVEEILSRLAAGSKSFQDRARSGAAIDLRELLDPEGDAVGSLVDVEVSAGAAALALPMDLITFETWVLGHIGDRDELDLDVQSHKDLWFQLGAWIGETLRLRHGGFWLLGGDDPSAWRLGFSKILLEIVPHVFADKLLRAGPGLGRRMLSEIERLRQLHEQQAEADGGRAKERYAPMHYARLHSVPLAQWMVLDMARLQQLWGKTPAGELRAQVSEDGKKLPPQNAPVLAKVDEALAGLDVTKTALEQVQDRGLYEAVAQIVGMRRATAPLAIDIVEKLIFPAMHMGIPEQFPPLDEDDLGSVKKGTDLFAVFVDVVPFVHQAEEGGFLGSFAPADMTTPYPDRQNLELGKGDWVGINPGKLLPVLAKFDPNKLLLSFEKFVDYVQKQPGVPRVAEVSRALAETTARAILDFQTAVAELQAKPGRLLVFRLLPPPA
jgi:hypothetical protein